MIPVVSDEVIRPPSTMNSTAVMIPWAAIVSLCSLGASSKIVELVSPN